MSYKLIIAVRATARTQGVTQPQLAKAAGCSVGTVSRWLTGKNPNISADSVARMLDLLGLEIGFGHILD